MWTSLSFYHNGDKDSRHLIRTMMWCTRFILSVAFVCIICERLLSMRVKTKILVNDIIMDYDQPPPIRLQAKAFMELIVEWPLTISVYEMFNVDLTLLVKFINVCTTYLIVIVQVLHIITK
ncbi:hypothetical protein EVAR_84751_1 [Eumeta japonica]|uniref:Uncharacterized protein n=1 Tax=Eumeta variegata TaxID=151549 RepID=A0A4C1U9A9_EUMVA|nr:hypothetical protein EVAR_84751_1 [Eumeta japonica]